MQKVFLAILALASLSAWCVPQQLSSQGGEVNFLATTNASFIKIQGKGNSLSGQVKVDGATIDGNFEFGLAQLSTGIGKRDDHMKKYLEVEKFPKAALALKSASPITGWSKEKPKLSDAEFNGILSLHGQDKPVTGKFDISDSGKVDVRFKVKLSEFGIEDPSFAGVTVNDTVEVEVKIDKLQ